MAFQTKVYIVQRADADGKLLPETPVAVKLTYGEARKIAVTLGIAPARITFLVADKTSQPNGEGQIGHHSVCNSDAVDSKRNGFHDIDNGGAIAANFGRK
jgi:hypothetical protein